ncbi:MAG: carboxylesterase family protein [Firmicutes bacterium]|nr:carboxylesterase family protein [Bacillota bacterium]
MIKTVYGLIEGIEQGTYIEYRGIPFAKPPVGELRWAAPQKPDPFDGVYHAVSWRNKAVQTEGSAPPWDKDFYDDEAFNPPASEDCLYLHIWTPNHTDADTNQTPNAAAPDHTDAIFNESSSIPSPKYPVAIWIHGGAFMHGWGSEKEFDGAGYAKRGVILVSIEYRMGVFGFLAHPALTEEAGRSGNYGILDQIAALDWVRENIAAFGGDPDNITVFGQSAGAMSTQTLISSPLTKGKIAKAILQSGGSYGVGLHGDDTMKDQERYGLVLQEILGKSSIEEMRSVPAMELLEAQDALIQKVQEGGSFKLPLAPGIDGYVLPDGYYKLMDQNEIHDIPYLLGSTKDDIGSNPKAEDPRDSMLYHGCIRFSQKLEELGRKPAYVYWFKRNLPGDNQGAWHSSELWYTMDTLDRCWRPWEEGDYVLRDQIMTYWTNFMKTGDPNRASSGMAPTHHADDPSEPAANLKDKGNLPVWQPCSIENPFVMELDV